MTAARSVQIPCDKGLRHLSSLVFRCSLWTAKARFRPELTSPLEMTCQRFNGPWALTRRESRRADRVGTATAVFSNAFGGSPKQARSRSCDGGAEALFQRVFDLPLQTIPY